MGKCLSNKAVPTDYGELTAGNTEKVTPRTTKAPSSRTYSKSDGTIQTEKGITKRAMNGLHTSSSAGSIAGPYRKMSTESERDTDFEYEQQNIVIDESIVIEDFVKIYDEKQQEYQHYGLLLNQKQCKLYLVNPHYFYVWKEFEKLSKINTILTSDRHDNKVQRSTLKCGQKDAEEMICNLCQNQLENINAGAAINFLMNQNKYDIEKQVLLNKKWDISLSTLLKIDSDLFEKYVNHIVITRYEQNHIRSIFAFFRSVGHIVKYHSVDTQNDHGHALHLIFADNVFVKDIATLNEKLCQSVRNEFDSKLNKEIRIHISPYYDPIIHSSADTNEDVKVLDLQMMFVSVEPFTEFDDNAFDGNIYGFKLNAKANQNHLLCLLDDNNKRFEWITHLDYVLNNNEFIKRKYSSKLRNKRSNMVNLDKRLFGQTNTCNHTSCTYIERLIAINHLYTRNKDDIADIIINRNVDIISIYDCYIHCVMSANRMHTEHGCECSVESCIHYMRFNIDKHSKENRIKYYNEHVIRNCDVINILDQIHCFLCHNDTNTKTKQTSSAMDVLTKRRRKNSEKFIRNWSEPSKPTHNERHVYFGGKWTDYWSPYSVADRDSADNIFIDDDYDHQVDGAAAIVFPKWDTLKEELTQNTVCALAEEVYNDIYKQSMCFLSTRYCQKHMKAVRDHVFNEKMAIAPGNNITVNHIISIVVYCNYFNVCSQWIEAMRMNTDNEHDEGEFAHFYRYLAELCQLFGSEMKDDEYLYIISFDQILFSEWSQMIYFPISVTPPLSITQSFMKELRQYHDNDDVKHDSNSKHILKLASCDLDGIKTKYFDVRWLSDSYDEDERFIMMSRVKIYDILLDQRRSCLKDIYAIQLFQRIMSGSFFRCVTSLNQMETQKKLFALIQNHIYSNTKQKALEKFPSFKYIQDIFDNLVHDAIKNKINNRCIIWLHKSELNKLKCRELALTIYNLKTNETGTLLKHHKIHKQQIKFVKEYEFKIEEKPLKDFIEGKEIITSEDHDYVLDSVDSETQEKISLYFELNKKELGWFLWCNLILLPSTMDKVLLECNVHCDDLNHEVQFEPVWASKDNDNDNVGGLVFNQDLTKNMSALQSLSFIISLKVLQTNAVRSPTKSILTRFP